MAFVIPFERFSDAGGSGSAIVMGLPYLHQAMGTWGYPYGLEVTLMDGDIVSKDQLRSEAVLLAGCGTETR